MKNGLFIGLAAIAGFGAGAATGYLVAKKKFDDRVNEEVESVRQIYRPQVTEEPEPERPERELQHSDLNKPNIMEYHKIVSQNGYDGNNDQEPDEEESVDTKIISPEEFGTNETYEQISLTYTEDGYLLDEDDEPMEDPENFIGMPAKEVEQHFGEYEDDSVFVRNDDAETYYEILMSNKRYTDMTSEE